MTLYTADRLAEMLGIQRSTVQQLVRAGEFGPTVNVARKHLVTEDGLAGFIARRTGPATTTTGIVTLGRSDLKGVHHAPNKNSRPGVAAP